MKHFLLLCLLTCAAGSVEAQPSNTEIYHDGWIDLNKNGRRDIYEDRRQAVERRVENLLRQMTLDEKTAQMATLYGSGRVLKDALPTPAWHNEVWKDGIGNIDEQHNGLGKFRSTYSYPYARSVEVRRAVQEGLISERTIDDRVRDILRVKFELGLFDNPYVGDPEEADRLVHCEAHQALSLEAARQSLVLLKNEANLLPLDKTISSLAVIGPNADEVKELICRYGPANTPIISVLEGLRQHLPNTEIRYAKGCEIVDPHFPMSEIMEYAMTTDEERLLHEAVEVAQASEVVVVLGGSERTVRESRSRTDLRLPGRQEELLKAVLKAGRPTVLVMVDGRAATINYAQAHVPAILHVWFPGEKMGLAIAETLFGDYNPGGKLPVTFPKTVGQLPYAFPFKPGVDVPSESSISGALYPFGYGLSYTTFRYDDLRISNLKIGPKEELEVSCTITNTGERRGDEVVQLYLNDCVSSVTTYTKVLRGFERITLRPKESRRVTFRLDRQDLGLWNRENRFVVEPGRFEVMIGSSSQDIRLDGSFEVVE